MRYILLICFFILFQFISFSQVKRIEIIECTSQNLKLDVNLPEIKISKEVLINGKIYTKLNVTEESIWLNVGKPGVPVINKWILLPNELPPEIEIETGEPEILTGIELPPVQEPLLDCECDNQRKFIIDSITYSTDADYPGNFTEISPVKNRREYKLTELLIFPYQYNPVKKTLKIYNDLKIHLIFKGAPSGIPERLYSITTEDVIKHKVINAEPVIKAINKSEIINDTLFNTKLKSSPGGCEYLIITHDNFIYPAIFLKDWKNSLGIATEVVKTSDINGSYDSFDDDAKRAAIEDYIDNVYNTWNPCPEYILLFGDAEFIPPHYFYIQYIDTITGDTLMGAWYASDLEYADVGSLDYQPEFSYGRIPADDTTEARYIVNKIWFYEQGEIQPSGFYNKAAVIAYVEDVDDVHTDMHDTTARRFIKTCEDTRNYLINEQGMSVDRLYYTQPDWYPTNYSGYYQFENDVPYASIPTNLQKPNYNWDADSAKITQAVEDGRFMILYRDHGGREKWQCYIYGRDLFTINDIDLLTNYYTTPVIFSICCSTGWFDNETDDDAYNEFRPNADPTGYDDESFVEHWIKKIWGGAAGIVGSSRASFSNMNDRLAWGFMDAIFPDFIEYQGGSYSGSSFPVYRLGDIIKYGKDYVDFLFSGYWLQYTIREFNYMGDPTMRIFPYKCETGTVSLQNDEQDEDLEINACKEVLISNYTINTGFDLTIKTGGELNIFGPFNAETGSTLSFEGADIRYDFKE
ncbi:MAG: hypothetical protein JXB17_13380 [Bacteroidales bacterium]|nr:hypothetical protein [Bacteroidales bacterium]